MMNNEEKHERKRRWKPEDDSKLKKEWQRGNDSSRKAAPKLGFSQSSIVKNAKRLGLKGKPGRPPGIHDFPERDAEIYAKYISGCSASKLAKLYGLSRSRINVIVRREKERG